MQLQKVQDMEKRWDWPHNEIDFLPLLTGRFPLRPRLDEKENQVRDAMRTVAQTQEMQIGRSKELAEERDKLLEDLSRRMEESRQIT